MNNEDQKKTEFAVFCIENTAARLGISGTVVYQELKSLDGIRLFLFPSYNALHTQSKDYIVDETLQFIHKNASDFQDKKVNVDVNPLVNDTLLQMKYSRIINLLAERLTISNERALDLFYNSDTYLYMSQKRYHLHNMSDAYLVDEILLEVQSK